MLVFIEHGTRRLHVAGVTARPTGAWAVQQARNFTMDLDDRLGTLRFLSHDRDPTFTTAFAEVFKGEGLRSITTLPGTPRMNAICERVIGTLRRELLDRVLVLGERHLALMLREDVTRCNGHRPHQSRQQRPPDIETQPVRDAADLRYIRRKSAAAGVINEYHHAARSQLRPRNSIFERYTIRSPSPPPRSSQVWLKWCRNPVRPGIDPAPPAAAGNHLGGQRVQYRARATPRWFRASRVPAGERADDAHGDVWSGAGSTCRPSALQLDDSPRHRQ